MLNGRGETVETNRITASFRSLFPFTFFVGPPTCFVEDLIRGWADGRRGGSTFDFLVVFRDIGTDLTVVCGKEIGNRLLQ